MSTNLLNYIFAKVSKKLKFGVYKRTGKNFSGKICVFHRGGGNKKIYRVIDFYRRLDAYGVVCEIQFDACRSAYIGLILYDNGMFSYIIVVDAVLIGSKLFSGIYGDKYGVTKGSSLLLSNIPLFSIVNNVETRPFYGASLARAAGLGAIFVAKENNYATLKLRSG